MTKFSPRSEWLVDRLAESWSALSSRPWRAVLTALATAVGVAGYVGVTGTSAIAQRDVQRRFDELRPTSLVANSADPSDDNFSLDSLDTVARLPGVDGAMITKELTVTPKLQASRAWAPEVIDAPVVREARVQAVLGDGWAALGATPAFGRFFDRGHGSRQERVVVLGEALARDLGIVRPSTGSALVLGGVPFVVVGIARGFADYPDLRGAAFVPEQTATAVWGSTALDISVVSIRCTQDALPRIAAIADRALRPDRPSAVQVTAPPSPASLRRAVTSDLSTLVLVLSIIVFASGGLSIATNSLASVLERRTEIGLRRALGARGVDLAAQFVTEATVLGAAGGGAGAALGQLAVLAFAAIKGTDPVLLTEAVLLAPIGGALLGFIAGLFPAVRAARVEPVQALRAA